MARLVNPLGVKFPLAEAPYNSRVAEQEIQEEGEGPVAARSKNYVSIAFRPGYALQAAELNEIQEHYQMQMTLTMNMYTNWITSSTFGTPPEDPAFAVSAPGWYGATPLFPGDNPYIPGGATKLVEVETAGAGITVTIRPGWFLVSDATVADLRDNRNQNDNDTVSGLLHWIYNDDTYEFNIAEPGQITHVGFKSINKKYVEPDEDNTLYDNTGGSYNTGNPVSGGAGRFQLQLTGASFGNDSDGESRHKIIKIDPTLREIRYMNNLFITSY